MRRTLLLPALAVALAACGGEDRIPEEEGLPAGGASIRTITITETEFELNPSTVRLDERGTYTFKVINRGQTTHALEIEGHGIEEESPEVGPGESTSLKLTLTQPGTYELYCPVGDHEDRGMRGTLVVESVGTGTTTEGVGTRETETGKDDDTSPGTTGETDSDDDDGGNSGTGSGY